MITYVRTNIFESNAQVLVNTVNTVGVMGKGLALQFKKLYPEMFASYQKLCDNKSLSIGKLQIYRTPNKWILNFPTKADWRQPSKIEYIELGLQKFVANYELQGVSSISFPMLGCGNGNLEWSVAKPIMEKYLKNLPMEVFVHISEADALKPEHTNQSEIENWLKSTPEYLSSTEFLTHLRQKYSGLLNHIDKLGLQIDVSIEQVDEEVAFCLKYNSSKVCLAETTLVNIWQALKNDGVCQREMLSSELVEHSDAVMAFLSELEYIALTQIGDGETQVAVRLLAYKQPIENSLKEQFAA